jgi:hypothetical protein
MRDLTNVIHLQFLILFFFIFSLGAIMATEGMACTMEHHSMVDMAMRHLFCTQTCTLQHMEPTLTTATSN